MYVAHDVSESGQFYFIIKVLLNYYQSIHSFNDDPILSFNTTGGSMTIRGANAVVELATLK